MRQILQLLMVLGACAAILLAGHWLRREHASGQLVLPPPLSATSSAWVAETVSVQPSATSTPVAPASSSVAVVPPKPAVPALLRSLRLNVPFLSQAPNKNWDMPYQEACEEASMLMVQAFFAGQSTRFSADAGDAAILAFVDWQAQRFGADVVDLTANQVVEAIHEYMPELEAEVKPLQNADDIKQELAKGFPVILPADGKTLANPRFRNGGPRYHMLVIKGYLDDGRWITNDPGTQFGEDFVYPQENLLTSAHDWNDGDVPNGASVMVVVKQRKSVP